MKATKDTVFDSDKQLTMFDMIQRSVAIQGQMLFILASAIEEQQKSGKVSDELMTMVKGVQEANAKLFEVTV